MSSNTKAPTGEVSMPYRCLEVLLGATTVAIAVPMARVKVPLRSAAARVTRRKADARPRGNGLGLGALGEDRGIDSGNPATELHDWLGCVDAERVQRRH